MTALKKEQELIELDKTDLAANVVATITADAQDQPKTYLRETEVPAGGE